MSLVKISTMHVCILTRQSAVASPGFLSQFFRTVADAIICQGRSSAKRKNKSVLYLHRPASVEFSTAFHDDDQDTVKVKESQIIIKTYKRKEIHND